MASFISIEGLSKSVKLNLVFDLKKELFGKAVFIQEPSDVSVGSVITELKNDYDLEPISEILLFCSSFIETSHKIVYPKLESGSIVITDRWFYSAIAFQEFSRGQYNNSLVEHLCKLGNVAYPDFNIILDMPLDSILWEHNCLPGDKGRITILERAYLYYTTECPGILIDATQTRETLLKNVLDLLRSCSLI